MLATAIACGMLLTLPCCAIPNLRHGGAGPGLPASFDRGRPAPESSAQLGVEEFYNDPILTGLIRQALAGNRELKILNEEVQIASNEILSRAGCVPPLRHLRGQRGAGQAEPLSRPWGPPRSNSTTTPASTSPIRWGISWAPSTSSGARHLEAACTTPGTRREQRYFAAVERRNFFVTRLVADIAENYYRLLALDKRLETLNHDHRAAGAEPRGRQGPEGSGPRHRAGRSSVSRPRSARTRAKSSIVRQEIIEAENRINFLANRFPQPVERTSAGFFDLTIHAAERGSARAAAPEPARHPPGRARAGGRRARREGRPGRFFPALDITGGVGYQAFNPKYLFNTPEALVCQRRRRAGRAADQQEGDPGRVPHRERPAVGERLQLPARRPQRLHRGRQPRVDGGELPQEHRDQEAAVGIARGLGRRRQQAVSERPASNTWKCCWPSATSWTRGRS